jgi:hypothetical protein
VGLRVWNSLRSSLTWGLSILPLLERGWGTLTYTMMGLAVVFGHGVTVFAEIGLDGRVDKELFGNGVAG